MKLVERIDTAVRNETKQNGIPFLVIFLDSSASSLKVNIALDGDIGSLDVSSVDRHINVGGPRRIVPFDVEAVIGLQVRREGAIIGEAAFPFHGEVTLAVHSGRNTIIGVHLLGERDFLVVRRRRKTNVRVVVTVVQLDIASVILEVEARGNGLVEQKRRKR